MPSAPGVHPSPSISSRAAATSRAGCGIDGWYAHEAGATGEYTGMPSPRVAVSTVASLSMHSSIAFRSARSAKRRPGRWL